MATVIRASILAFTFGLAAACSSEADDDTESGSTRTATGDLPL